MTGASRRWIAAGIIVVAAAVVLRLVLAQLVAPLVRARLAQAIGVDTHVETIELRLLAGEVVLHGVHAAPHTGASSLRIETVTLAPGWRSWLHDAPFLDARASGIALTVDLQQPWPRTYEQVQRRAMLRSLDIEDGTVALVVGDDTNPVIAFTDLHVRLEDSSHGASSAAMSTHASVRATAGERGSLMLDVSFAAGDPSLGVNLRFALEQLDLRGLNPLLLQVFAMDVEQGWFSLHGEITVGLGRVRGRVQPSFADLRLLAPGEANVQHPMAEALLTEMLAAADLPIFVDRPFGLAGTSPFEDLAAIDGVQVIHDVVLRGFIRRLDTLAGYDARVGSVELDFSRGRLSFFDVALEREGGKVDRPFVAVERLDIVVEQTAVDRGTPTYKAITLHRPVLTFVTGTKPDRSQLTFDPDWQDKISVLPYPTDRVEIIDGRVEYRDDTTTPTTTFFVSDVDLLAANIGRAREDPSTRGAHVSLTGRVMQLGALEIVADVAPGAIPLDAAVALELGTLPLPPLNDLLRGRFGVDISTGTVAIDADFDVEGGHLSGTVTPHVHDVRVLGPDETEMQRPLRELMLDRRLRKLDDVTLVLEHDVRFSVVRELPAVLLLAALHAQPAPRPKLVSPWKARKRARLAGATK